MMQGMLISRDRAYEIVETTKQGDRVSFIFDVFMVSLITINVLAVILGTVKEIEARYGLLLLIIEVVSVLLFTVEYVVRLWSAASDARYARPVSGRVRFALRPMMIIDLFAILPFYLGPLVGVDGRFLRALRLFRILRLLKIARYSRSLQLMRDVLIAKVPELTMTLMVLMILLLVSGSMMYYLEHEAQPEVFSSIPASLWWGIATLTTVGYGDAYPVTALGKMLGGFIAVLGIGLFALPAGILASGFSEAIQRAKQQGICPTCGRGSEDAD